MAHCKRAKNVKRWTLLALNGRHLGYVAEEDPFRQLFILFLKTMDEMATVAQAVDHGGSCRDCGGIEVSTWGGERGKQGTQRARSAFILSV